MWLRFDFIIWEQWWRGFQKVRRELFKDLEAYNLRLSDSFFVYILFCWFLFKINYQVWSVFFWILMKWNVIEIFWSIRIFLFQNKFSFFFASLNKLKNYRWFDCYNYIVKRQIVSVLLDSKFSTLKVSWNINCSSLSLNLQESEPMSLKRRDQWQGRLACTRLAEWVICQCPRSSV